MSHGNNVTGKVNQNSNFTSQVLPCTNIISIWIKYFNLEPEALKLLEENMGNTLHNTGGKGLSEQNSICPGIKATN